MNDRSDTNEDSLRSQLEGLSEEQRRLFELLLSEEGAAPSDGSGGIERQDRSSPKPLSYAQERVWKVSQLTPDLPIENVPVCFRLDGPLQVNALKEAIHRVCRRHDILRSRYRTESGRVIQTVVDHVPPLRVLPASSVELQRLIEQEAHWVFDFSAEDLIRFTLICNSSIEHVLIISTHQLLTDGYSFRLLLREISDEYCARVDSGSAEISEPPIQYSDYSVWQLKSAENGDLDEEIDYWVKQLDGAPEVLSVGDKEGWNRRPSYDSADVEINISEEESRRIRELSRKQGVTTFMTLLAAFQVVLARAAQANDVVVGTLISNRNRSETESLIGNFSNNLLLRLTLQENDTFVSALARVRETVVAAYAHQEGAFQLVADRFRRMTGKAAPAFQTMLLVRDGMESSYLTLERVKAEQVDVDFGLSRLDLSLDIVDDGSGPLVGKLQFKTGVVSKRMAHGLAGNLKALLKASSRDASRQLRSVELPHVLAPVSVRSQSLERMVSPETETEKMLHSLWTQLFPGRDIGVSDDFFDLGGRSLTAIELVSLVNSTFGIVLPISTLYHASTIRELAAHIVGSWGVRSKQAGSGEPGKARQSAGSAELPQQVDAETTLTRATSTMRWLVPIKPSGTRPPLFVIHGFGGGVFYFRPVAGLLEPDQPVFGLQSRGLEGEAITESSVEEMAALYLEEILKVEPEGPYHVTSWCVGGFVAFEIARQLLERGKEVASVSLLDVVAPSARGEYFESRSAETGAAPFRERLRNDMSSRDSSSSLGVVAHGIRRGLRSRRRKASRFARVALANALASVGIKVPQSLRGDYIRETYRKVMTSYHPEIVDVKVVLVRGEESSRRSSKPDLGWSDYAAAGVEVVDLNLPHSQIKESPGQLAAVFTKFLTR